MQVNLERILALNSLKYHKTLAFLDFDFSFGIFTFYKVCLIQYAHSKIAYQILKSKNTNKQNQTQGEKMQNSKKIDSTAQKKSSKIFDFKILALYSLLATSTNALEIPDIKIDTKGTLGAVGAADFASSNSHIGVMAKIGATFSLENGFVWGIGAIGGWTPWVQRETTTIYASSGDAAQAYIGYENSLVSFFAGRFDNEFAKFEWLGGNVQGLSLRFKTYEETMSYWLTYANSYLYNGAQKDDVQGERIAANLGSLISYNTGSRKNELVGGEIVAGGVDFDYKGVLLKPFVLFNTKVQNSFLLQGGIKAGLNLPIGQSGLFSYTTLRAMYQYWDIAQGGAASSVLVWGDEAMSIKNFNFGGGVVWIMGNRNNRIYALSDSSRFYGRSFFGNGIAPYLQGSSLYGYVFGGIDLQEKIGARLDVMISFGTYTEYSIMSDFALWKREAMRLSAGVGYAYMDANNFGKGNSLRAFVRFAY